jgi:hypothetical protein
VTATAVAFFVERTQHGAAPWSCAAIAPQPAWSSTMWSRAAAAPQLGPALQQLRSVERCCSAVAAPERGEGCSAAAAPHHEEEGDDSIAVVAFFFAISCVAQKRRRRSKCCLWSYATTLRILCSAAPQTNKINTKKNAYLGPAWVRLQPFQAPSSLPLQAGSKLPPAQHLWSSSDGVRWEGLVGGR